MKVRSVLRSIAEHAICTAPRRTKRGDRLILSYHNVLPPDSPPVGDRSLHLSAGRFKAQLRILQQETDVVPLLELLSCSDSSSRLSAITFDDAYLGALTFGVGLCEQAGIPCTVFVSPALLGSQTTWDLNAEKGAWSDAQRNAFLWQHRGLARTDEELIQLEPCRIATKFELLASASLKGVTIGNHSMRHANLGALSFDGALEELRSAGEWLKIHCSSSIIPVVAYPYGIPPRESAEVLPTLGLRYGLLVDGGWLTSTSHVADAKIPRWNVPAGVSDRGFQMRIRGWLANAG